MELFNLLREEGRVVNYIANAYLLVMYATM